MLNISFYLRESQGDFGSREVIEGVLGEEEANESYNC